MTSRDGRTPLFVILSGLPASGKSTLGRALAQALELPLLDKDDILEALFESLGGGDAKARDRLSRAADLVLRTCAMKSPGAVLVSWWKHPASADASGTDTGWLSTWPARVLEVHCQCPPDLAVARFFARRRHPGHLDGFRSPEDERARFERAARLGPLGVGPLLACNTAAPLDLPLLLGAIRKHAA